MRPSSAASIRTSHFGTGVSSATRLLEKKREFEAVKALDKISLELVERLEALGDDCEIMAEAGQVFGSVMDHWSRMFGIISLVVPPSRESTDNNEKHPVEQQPPKAEKLVRLEIASLEQASSSK